MEPDFSRSAIGRIDSGSIRDAYRSWPSLAEQGAKVAVRLRQGAFRRVLFLGVGGSASAGDIISGWMSIRHRLPFSVHKGYIPERDLRNSLAIACSASGETKETLQMTEWALRCGAYVVTLSSGGKLARLSKKKGIPHVNLPEIVAPRYILPFLLFATISILRRKFELAGVDEEVEDAIREMRELAGRVDVTVPMARNESKQLGLALVKPIPKIYGSTVTRGAALRFKNVLNENAKKHASVDFAPELFHNEIEAWEGGGENFLPVFLRHPKEPISESRRLEAMIGVIAETGVRPLVVSGRGRTDLAQLLTLVYKLDFASYYTAIGRRVDPLPTRLLDRVKRKS